MSAVANKPLDTKEQAKYLMASTSLGTVEIAGMLGVSPSLISQYKTDPAFMEAVLARKALVGIGEIKRDERKDLLEDALIDRLESAIPMIFKPMEITRALQVVSSLQRRSRLKEVLPQDIGDGSKVVSISLPKHTTEATITLKLNSNKEIVEVAGREMRSMGVVEVMAELERANDNNNNVLIENGEVVKPTIDLDSIGF